MDAELRCLLETAYPGEQTRYFPPISIGSTPEHADEGATLILNGVKTFTSSAFWMYPDGKIPFVGALSVLLDGARRPRGIVETTRVEIKPFQAITEDMAQEYGEGERAVDWWRRTMAAFYQASAVRHGCGRAHYDYAATAIHRRSNGLPDSFRTVCRSAARGQFFDQRSYGVTTG
jgi:uncharacterized protein YhfF